MASTRNNNMPGEYCLQQKSYNQGSAYLLNKSKRVASHSTIPCPGVNHGQVPNTVLAYNATDIESSLFGINSSNLVQPQNPVQPKLKTLDMLSFAPRLHALLPEPLIVEKCQRPTIFRR
jgi:hypothetical protein